VIALTCMCGKKYSIDDVHAGRQFTCRACGAGMAVPSLADFGVPAADQPEPAAPTPPRTAVPTDSQVLRRMCNSLERIEGSVWWIHVILAVPFVLGLLGAALWVLNAVNSSAYQAKP
jgi:hypothetical protein